MLLENMDPRPTCLAMGRLWQGPLSLLELGDHLRHFAFGIALIAGGRAIQQKFRRTINLYSSFSSDEILLLSLIQNSSSKVNMTNNKSVLLV
jgi:hypothetical protein